MTFVTATRRAASDIDIAAYVYHLIGRFADYRAYRKTVTELNKLSSRDLADLGFSRASIHSVAYEAVYGK